MISEKIFKVFPIISLWELYVAIAIRVSIQLTPNPMQPFPLHYDAFTNWPLGFRDILL